LEKIEKIKNTELNQPPQEKIKKTTRNTREESFIMCTYATVHYTYFVLSLFISWLCFHTTSCANETDRTEPHVILLSYTKAPIYDYSVKTGIGSRSSQEDAYCATENDQYIVLGVYDGHGGRDVSCYISHQIPRLFLKQMRIRDNYVATRLERIYRILDYRIAENSKWSHTGSTAVTAVFDKKTNVLTVANAGDSRLVIIFPTDIM
jgi:hypothetical protein